MARMRKATAIVVPLALSVAVVAFAGPAESKLPQQSPIDVTLESLRYDPHLPPLNVSYGHSDIELTYIRKDQDSPTGCTTRDHEETEEAEVEPGAGHVTLSGVRYDLVQFHFHTPSEHRFHGQSTPLEMHLVHRNAAQELLVIGIPLTVGPASTVDKVLADLAPECGANVHVGEIDLNTLLPHDRTTARYNGSLTTYPFSENVKWFLMREKTVTQATITRFQQLFTSGNARATQPLNGRTVTVGRPHI
ncbi:carbonic anhydrase family protein [Kibdelosporangium persicum]|uniref:carbonic anhydrase n=1 Tax=Kibdelosporangium persicum TaxID=2698649 RepID=A0ABX2EZJ4_9PSEU|nr:carbonic anhydrase family protein [Kibdelosporangium persicum]NRN64171.1 Carbonate dehydratase [Kibdelosporangium persicum]